MGAPTEIVTLKTQVFIEFPCIWLSNLKSLECTKSNFAFKVFVFMPSLLLLCSTLLSPPHTIADVKSPKMK